MRLERIGVAVALILLVALPGCAAENHGSSLPGSAGAGTEGPENTTSLKAGGRQRLITLTVGRGGRWPGSRWTTPTGSSW